ncbi:ATP-binding cassette domain-containing protein [Epidermidibacterium keratini]|uniref:ATP-binding cassette domain-containing protein n=1 Tax=Epidermidibacterium keratini TaxID=1891644 RepID=A0A7L4YPR6_9ACTN|nr:ATP-binding cassette domain-containing protein [Epidermidibacterium keratini]QHC01012.1 ATP-binding cassette domain-containing protein [Epidermidibacterium keratini]
MIDIERLSKTYQGKSGTVAALTDVTLHVEPGEIYGIVGRSGAGKSTLLRHLNLLERPTSGTVRLDGRDLGEVSAQELRATRRSIGVVFQHFNLLGARTVAGNVEFPLEIAGISKKQRRERVTELLGLVGLTDKAAAYPSQLSGGQKQRVGIARALAANPKVLLCDEATSALDTDTTAQILELIAKINRELGITVVLITHELEVVRRICHSAALLDDGRVVESGRLSDLLSDPDSALAERILPTGLGGRVLAEDEALITLRGDVADTAILSELSRDLHLDVVLRGGGIEHVGDTAVSRLLLQLRPEEGQLNPLKTREYLEDRGAQVVLG